MTYSLPYWAEDFFDINPQGEVIVRPRGKAGPEIPLPELVAAAHQHNAKLPLLLRFPDVLAQRLHQLHHAFQVAQAEAHYTGGYTAVYPIKVNQHHGVASTLASVRGVDFGLEAGSKPELMAVLALSQPGGLVICNGYKDHEYIRLALLGRKLGLQTYIIIEKPSELTIILELAQAMNIRPGLGIRVRLSSLGKGKWQNSGGDKSKFGVSACQLLELCTKLTQAKRLDCLNVLHFHMGSQISNVRDIAKGMREATRYFTELVQLGAPITHVDVGGGLGVDYEGTRSRSECSMNYSLQAYAHHIVQALADVCQHHGTPAPRIITECGRAMTAHHAVLITDVVDVEKAPEGAIGPSLEPTAPAALRHLHELYQQRDIRPITELFHEAEHYYATGLADYEVGQLDLAQRARLDDIFYAVLAQIRARLTFSERNHRPVLDALQERLVDKYFVNFSIFESIPDVWAINQIFPILPITHLQHQPTRHGVLADLTCDSDGMIKDYVQNQRIEHFLPLHPLDDTPTNPYLLGIFLVGAYQEILGDIHNLFGDTDAVEVRVVEGGYSISPQRRGDTVDVLLDYVGYPLHTLRAAYHQLVQSSGLPHDEAQHALDILDVGLQSSPYLRQVQR